ncbi:MAG: diguanylate cyclase [Pseudomonadota bacterium]
MDQKQARFKIWLGAGIVVLAFAVVLSLVIFTSAKQAGFIVAETERKLITQEIDRELEDVLQLQAEISFWDATIEALRSSSSDTRAFWRSELVQWFTWDADFQLGVVLDNRGQVVFAAELGEEVSAAEAAFYASQNNDLIQKARDKFDLVKVERDAGFLAPVDRLTGLPDIAVGGYRYVDGEFGIVTAQVIVGETEAFAIGADGWHVLFGFLPLGDKYAGDFAKQLGLDPRYVELAAMADGFRETPHMVAYPNAGGEPQAYFRWRPKRMGLLIMSHIAPFAALLFILLVAAVLIPLRAFSKTVELLAESEAINRKMANHDALTGLPNRMQFDNKLDGLLADPAGDPFAVMCIDLDRFKAVNDAYGHNAGDAVLVTVAERLCETIADKGLVARVGGDEFVAIITENVDNDHLSWLGDALIDQATQPVMFGPVALEVGCSIGVSVWPRHGRSAAEIISAADTFLYESKRAGRGCVTIGRNSAPPKRSEEAVA